MLFKLFDFEDIESTCGTIVEPHLNQFRNCLDSKAAIEINETEAFRPSVLPSNFLEHSYFSRQLLNDTFNSFKMLLGIKN